MAEPGTDSEEMRLASHGGSAFSRPASEDKFNQENYPPQRGMSLRDYFAARAMAALISRLSRGESFLIDATAIAAYRMADGMLAERAKQ